MFLKKLLTKKYTNNKIKTTEKTYVLALKHFLKKNIFQFITLFRTCMKQGFYNISEP
jgi:hypothetical protein